MLFVNCQIVNCQKGRWKRKQAEGCFLGCDFGRGNRVEKYVKDRPDINAQAMDIEDLGRLGGQLGGPCPYFLTRTLASTSEMIFMPYNYLVDPVTRGGLKIDWSDCILIFDEAHNVTVRMPHPSTHPSTTKKMSHSQQHAICGLTAAERCRAG